MAGVVGSLVVIAVVALVIFICVSLLLAKRSQKKSQYKVDSNGNATLLSSNSAEYKIGKENWPGIVSCNDQLLLPLKEVVCNYKLVIV